MLSLLLTCALGASPAEHSDSVYSLSSEAFAETAHQDLLALQQLVRSMSAVMARVASNQGLFDGNQKSIYSPEQKQMLLSTWGELFAYFSATEGLRQKYWDFVKLVPTDSRHALGFLLTHTALTALLARGLQFSECALNKKQLETLFDEPNAEFGVPRGAFARFKRKAIHLSTSTQLFTGDTYAVAALPLLKQRADADTAVGWAMLAMQANSKLAKTLLVKHGGKLFLGNAKDIVIDRSAHAIFPVQKSFALWAGDTRVARAGRPLVSSEQIAHLVLPQLQPGDIIVSRQNWFLSNIGLPGFWPHAELYVGTAADLSRTFDSDREIAAWAQGQPEKAISFSELLQRRFPEKWKAYSDGVDLQGHGPIRVIESISEGVSFTAAEHAFGVDYLGVLRPKLPLLDKARAVERAFAYQGRPYDFDFDFFSDSTLVCTELVYKAYQPGTALKGLALDLVDVAGRRTLPANEIVKRFDREAGTPRAQMDFVLFLDGQEKAGRAEQSDEATFRATWKRLKWDIAQK